MNIKTKVVLILSYLMIVSGCAIKVGAHGSSYQDLDSVFGGVDVGENAKVGDISSVNGGIDIGSGATADEVETVNGGIEMGDEVAITSAETVNGGIEAGKSLTVKRGVETVNGGIRLGQMGSVGGSVTTVNGDIELTQITVEKNVETVNGDIVLSDKTVIKGDLVIEKPGGWFSSGNNDIPVLEIDATSSVVGTIHLHRQVELKIATGAKVGEIKKHFLRK